MTKIDLSIKQIQKSSRTKKTDALYGVDSIKLSPPHRRYHALESDVDGEGQMIASVLSKKIAAGSTRSSY
jgi:thymidine phosphorylase